MNNKGWGLQAMILWCAVLGILLILRVIWEACLKFKSWAHSSPTKPEYIGAEPRNLHFNQLSK